MRKRQMTRRLEGERGFKKMKNKKKKEGEEQEEKEMKRKRKEKNKVKERKNYPPKTLASCLDGHTENTAQFYVKCYH